MDKKKHIQIEDFPVIVTIQVAWGEMDAFAHVNNAVFIRYFENARIAYFDQVKGVFNSTSIGPILAEVSCKYIEPIHYPEQILVGANIPEIFEDRFTMNYGIFEKESKRCKALGTSVIVGFDYKKMKKATLPREWVEGMERIQKISK